MAAYSDPQMAACAIEYNHKQDEIKALIADAPRLNQQDAQKVRAMQATADDRLRKLKVGGLTLAECQQFSKALDHEKTQLQKLFGR